MSSPSAGDFSCADLVQIQSLAEQHFGSDVRDADVTPYTEAAQAVLANQTATMTELQNPAKDRTVQVQWVQSCELEVQDCTDMCENSGTEAGAQCKEYSLDSCKEVAVTIPEKRFRTSNLSREAVTAKLLAEAMKKMDEWWAGQVVTNLISFRGVNALTTQYDVVANDTYIPAASWNASLFGYFGLALAVNKLDNAYLLNGQNLYLAAWNAQMEQANSEGKGAVAKFNSMKKYWDLFNVDSIASDNVSFLINPDAIALFTKAYYPSVPREYNGDNIAQKRYSIPSKTLNGVTYDVVYSMKCENNEDKHTFRLMTKGDVLHNPLGCDSNRTGILMFTCGSAP